MKSLWMNRGSLKSPEGFDDRGFSFGLRVMTTMLVQGGTILDFDRHMERLSAHAELMGLGHIVDPASLRFEIEGLRSMQKSEFAICRIYVTAGKGDYSQTVTDPEVWTQLEPMDASRINTGPVKLDLQSDPNWRRGERIKTGLYPETFAAHVRAQAKGFSDVLWANDEQEIAECTTANIFLIGRDGDLVEIATPPASSGILLGVTRRRIIDLLNSAKIPVTERVIYREEIPRFDEAFKTSSISGIVPVSEIGSHKLHSGRPQSVVSHVVRLWNAWKQSQTEKPSSNALNA